MFEFMDMAYNYEQRKVDRYEDEDVTVDTCSVTDGTHIYETAIAHPEYYDGKWIVVEAYDTKEDAQLGHDKWVKTMTEGELPEYLQDCANAEVAQLLEDIDGDLIHFRTPPPKVQKAR